MRKLVVAVLAAAAVLVAAPAWAHEEINPSAITTGKPTFFTLSAANEKRVDLTRVTLAAPKDAPFGGTTREPAGWTVEASDTLITWTGGAVKADAFEQWGFETDGADQPGALGYKVTLGFADGTSDVVEVVVNAVAPGGSGPTGAATVKTGASAKTPADAGLASRTTAARGRANTAVAVAVAAALLALVALVLGVRRPRAAAATSPSSSPDALAEQDW